MKKPSTNILFSSNDPFSLPIIKENKSSDYWTWGDDNQYADRLLSMFYNSSLNNAIITGKVDYINGEGLFSESNNGAVNTWIEKCNTKGDSLYDVFKKCALDHEIFGGFAVQIIYSKVGGKIAEIYYVDVSRLRYSSDGTKLKYARDWSKSRVKTQDFDLFDPTNPVGTQIFYYNGSLSRDLYPIPTYIGSLAGIETSIEIANFHLNCITNGMFPSLMIDFKNGEPTEEEKRDIEKRIKEKWGGSSKAGKMMVTFSDKDNPSPTIQPVDQPDLDKRFLVLQDSVRDSIFIGHRITTPALFGLQVAGKLGTASEFNEGYHIFKKTYVKPVQDTITSIFNAILSVNVPEADLAVQEVQPLQSGFSEPVIAANMTKEEIRTKMKVDGWIENVEVEAQKQDSLAVQIGVGGLQSLQAILIDPALSPEAKKNALVILFDLPEEKASLLVGQPNNTPTNAQ